MKSSLITVSVLGLATFGAWQLRAQEPQAPDDACLKRLLQLGHALKLYQRDNDDKFPPADKWNDVLAPLIAKPAAASPFDCPSLGAGNWGYSMNWKLSKRAATELDFLGDTVSFYETNVPRKNANYDGRDLISRHFRQYGGVDGVPIRKESGGNVAFADGSVSWIPATMTPKFRIFLDNKPRRN